MTPAALAALRRLAALKSQRALGELAVARARAAHEAARAAAVEAAIARSCAAEQAEPETAPAQWRIRESLARGRDHARAAHRARLAEAVEVERRATEAMARELGAKALADAAAASAARDAARRAERAEGVLASLRDRKRPSCLGARQQLAPPAHGDETGAARED